MAHGRLSRRQRRWNVVRAITVPASWLASRQATRGHQAGEKELAQSALVGFRPHCAAIPQIAAPPSYKLGPFGDLKAREVQLGANFGP